MTNTPPSSWMRALALSPFDRKTASWGDRMLMGSAVGEVTDGLLELDPPAEDRRRARRALLRMLTDIRPGTPDSSSDLVDQVTRLTATAEDRREARAELLKLLPGQGSRSYRLVDAIVLLAVTTQDRHDTRAALQRVLTDVAASTDSRARYVARDLLHGISQLNPTLTDLAGWRTWPFPPAPELLASVRQESATDEWLAALPSLPA